MKTSFLAGLLLAATCMVTGGDADAQTYSFKLSGNYSAQWLMDFNPRPSVSIEGLGFIVNDVRGTFGGISGPLADLNFYAIGEGGGLEIDDPARGDRAVLITNGPQLYSGGEFTPTFRTGSYALTQFDGAGQYDLLIESVASVPEPASWGLMIVGLGVIGSRLRRRRSATRNAIAALGPEILADNRFSAG